MKMMDSSIQAEEFSIHDLTIHAKPCFDRAALQEHSWSVALLETEPCSDEYVAEPKLTDLPQLLAHKWHGYE